MKASRRTFLTGVGAAAAAAVSQSAFAQSAIDDILSSQQRGMWNDQFDARGHVQEAPVVSTAPILNPSTVAHVEQTLLQYQDIAARGGWPMVPAQKKLQLGVVDPDVQVLRERLMYSGDLSQQAGISPSFDTYVDAALKRFQTRHGLPADGVTGQYTYAAMNVRADVRLGQLRTNLDRLQTSVGSAGDRFVMVNIPAAQIEAVEGGRVVTRHNGVVGKIDRQTPILSSRINEIIVNPYWNAPESIVRRDIIPLMRKNPNYLTENYIRILRPDGSEVDPMTIDWSTEAAASYRFRQDPGRINAMASVKINFPNSHAVYMHDTPQQSLFNEIERFHSSGCVRVQNVRDLVTWLLRGTNGWSRQRFEDTIRSGESTPVALGNPTPVHFAYISAWATGDGVAHFRSDIYGLDGADELMISGL